PFNSNRSSCGIDVVLPFFTHPNRAFPFSSSRSCPPLNLFEQSPERPSAVEKQSRNGAQSYGHVPKTITEKFETTPKQANSISFSAGQHREDSRSTKYKAQRSAPQKHVWHANIISS